MIIVGLSMPTTKNGMKLNDGGCAIFKDGCLFAIAEERVSRVKHDGGYSRSLEYCLEAAGIGMDEVDLVVVSSCCEKALKAADVVIPGIPSEKIKVCPSHHLSHALGAFCLSPFQESLIMVLDNEGNIIESDDDEESPFYKRQMEHMSYYVGNSEHIQLIESDDVPTGKIGLGDAYRYFTHYLGFPSYVYAGKTMGLAAYGDVNAFREHKIFRMENGHIVCDISNRYFKPNTSVEEFLQKEGIKIRPRTPLDDLTKDHANLARWIQRETEDILIEKVNHLIEKTNITNLCIAGGVGLNSVANSEIYSRSGIKNIFILPAAGDTGQCVGNALYGVWYMQKKLPHIRFEDAYLGKVYSEEIIANEVGKLSDDPNYEVLYFAEWNDLIKVEAELLWNGQYVGHFEGRSEWGPRALGNRSILANPCSPYAKDDLNKKIKFRESFRPFAPIVLASSVDKYFKTEEELPFMLRVAEVIDRELIPAVTHVDGTARVQTVKDSQNKRMCDLLREFEKKSGVPILLNTSFNIAGEPIVETPQDAIECFKKTALNALVIGNYIVRKKKCNYPTDNFISFVTSLGANL